MDVTARCFPFVCVLMLWSCGGGQPDEGPIEVWAGYGWDRQLASQGVAPPIEASNVGLPVVVDRELVGRIEDITELARRTGLMKFALLQEHDGLVVGHVPGGDRGIWPRWVDCGSVDAAPGWRSGVVALESFLPEWDSGLTGAFYALGVLWRQGGEVGLTFLTQEPVAISNEKIPPPPIPADQLARIRAGIRAHVPFEGFELIRGTFFLKRWVGGKFRQVRVLWRADSDKFKVQQFVEISRFLAPELTLVGSPGADGGDAKTRAFMFGGPSLLPRGHGRDVLLLVRRGVSLLVKGKEVREQVELIWDSGAKKLRLGDCR